MTSKVKFFYTVMEKSQGTAYFCFFFKLTPPILHIYKSPAVYPEIRSFGRFLGQ
jgi:hypothetical protein